MYKRLHAKPLDIYIHVFILNYNEASEKMKAFMDEIFGKLDITTAGRCVSTNANNYYIYLNPKYKARMQFYAIHESVHLVDFYFCKADITGTDDDKSNELNANLTAWVSTELFKIIDKYWKEQK